MRKHLSVCIHAVLLLSASAALAAAPQQAPEEGSANAAEDEGAVDATRLDTVLVTAQKRVERLLDVPMSITAVSGDQLVESGVGSTNTLQQLVPGLTTVNNGLGFVPVIRGVSSQGTSPGDESNVSIYIDDVYVGAPLAGLFDLADIEQIEVLKGPQGTLFGRNATGGAIRIVTRKPSWTPAASVSADYGFKYNDRKVDVYATGPLSERVAGSLSGTYSKGDGHIEGAGPNAGQTMGGPDNYLVRGKLLFRPAESTEITLTADKVKSSNDLIGLVGAPEGANPFPMEGSVPSQPFRYAGSTLSRQRTSGESVAVNLEWLPRDGMSFRSITAYRDIELYEYQTDVDRTSLSLNALSLNQYQKNFSQEINLSGWNDSLSWVTGAYYYDSKAGNPFFTIHVGDAPINSVGNSAGPPLRSFTNNVDTSSYAAFGDLTWSVRENLHLTVGARYSSETKSYHYRSLFGPDVVRDDEKTWDSTTYRAIARYDINPDANVYVSLSNGFKSGVYDAYSIVNDPVDSEEVTAFEIGGKARVAGITLAAAAFDYDYEDIQVQSVTFVEGVPVLSLSNAASATMRGLEFSADGSMTDHWSFGVGLSWIPTAEFPNFESAQVTRPIPGAPGPILGEVVVPFDATGSRIPRTPEWTGNVRLAYSAPLAGGHFSGSVSAYYNAGFNWQPGGFSEEDAYEVVNARLGWTEGSGRFTYSVWASNLTDAAYSIHTVPNVRGDSRTYPQGRQFGVGFSARF